jgi:hypothetical protein
MNILDTVFSYFKKDKNKNTIDLVTTKHSNKNYNTVTGYHKGVEVGKVNLHTFTLKDYEKLKKIEQEIIAEQKLLT